MNWVMKVFLAVLIAVIASVVCSELLGPLLLAIDAAAAQIVGKFFVNSAYIIGLLCGGAWLVWAWPRWRP